MVSELPSPGKVAVAGWAVEKRAVKREQDSPTLEFTSRFQLPFYFLHRWGEKSLCANWRALQHKIHGEFCCLLEIPSSVPLPCPLHTWKREAHLRVKHELLIPLSKLKMEGPLFTSHFTHLCSWFSEEEIEIYRFEVVGPRHRICELAALDLGHRSTDSRSTVFSQFYTGALLLLLEMMIMRIICVCVCVYVWVESM